MSEGAEGVPVAGLPAEPPTPDSLESPRGPLTRLEAGLASLVLAVMVSIPMVEIVSRKTLHRSLIPGAAGYEEHLTLWIAFLGGALATKYRRHLALSTTTFFKPGTFLTVAECVSTAATVMVSLVLLFGAIGHVRNERAFLETLGGGIPKWIASVIMPLGYLTVAAGFWWRAPGGWRGRGLVLAAVALGAILWGIGIREERLLVPGIGLLAVATVLGMPLFAVMGGLAALLFHARGEPMSALAIETYALGTMPLLPTLPLFALAGTVLAAGGSSARLVGFFRALFGWAPAGTAVAAVVACAFFTAITGASGVTILAIGGLLLPILEAEGYPRRFAVGLLTAAGSIGLFFPPSLPVILYGIQAELEIEDLFRAGFFPGLLLVLGVTAYSVIRGRHSGVARVRFDPATTVRAIGLAKWDLFLPVFVIAALVAGVATLVEAAALTAAYAIFIEVVVHRTLTFRRDTLKVLMETAILIGALLFILGSALGLTGYMVGEEVPSRLADWVRDSVQSRFVFLLVLNLFLLVVGMLLDIFSAIIIVVPLILPLGEVFGVNPVHLGIVFLANLELGYLTPPVGLNLFLSSLRFKIPLLEVVRMTLPFILLFGLWVLLLTYVPALTLGVG